MQNTFRWALLALAIGCAAPARADINVGDEYTKKLKVWQTVQPLGEAPFGESVNLYTGEVSFSATDITFEGIGPPIRITRQLLKGDSSEGTRVVPTGFGDWTLDLPHISTLTPGDSRLGHPLGGWRVEGADGQPTNARCTQFGSMWSPPGGLAPKYGDFLHEDWWRGYQLNIGGTQEILGRAPTNDRKPTTGFYPAVTATHWQVGCLDNTSNLAEGEAFLALSPDGLRYKLDRLVYSDYQAITQNVDPNAEKPIYYYLTRKVGRMYVSRVTDRFNNAIDYTYDAANRLTNIHATDGRDVQLDWHASQPLITAIHVMPGTVDERTWTYQYVNPGVDNRLSAVVLPDGSRWTYDIQGIAQDIYGAKLTGCFGPGNVPPMVSWGSSPNGQVDATATITHPSGVTGNFAFAWRLRAQSSLPSTCLGQTGEEYESDNPFFRSLALITKTLSGPGLSPKTWRYDYEAAKPSVERYCPCDTTIYVDVTDPDTTVNRYTFSTRYDAMQGELVRVDYALANGVAAKTETREYYLPNGLRPYPSPNGGAMSGGNIYKTENQVPLRKTTTVQDGTTFVWEALEFDAYLNPIRVKRESTP